MKHLFIIVLFFECLCIQHVLCKEAEQSSKTYGKSSVKTEYVDPCVFMNIFEFGDIGTLKPKVNEKNELTEIEISCLYHPSNEEKYSDIDVECMLFMRAMGHAASYANKVYSTRKLTIQIPTSHSEVIARSNLNSNHLLFYFFRFLTSDTTRDTCSAIESRSSQTHSVYQLWDIKGTLLCLYITHQLYQNYKGKEKIEKKSRFEKNISGMPELIAICKSNGIDIYIKKYKSKKTDTHINLTAMTFRFIFKKPIPICSKSSQTESNQ